MAFGFSLIRVRYPRTIRLVDSLRPWVDLKRGVGVAPADAFMLESFGV